MPPILHERRLLDTKEAAEFLGVSASQLNKLRLFGGGPAFVKFGRTVRYEPGTLEAYVADHRRVSTSATVRVA